MNDCPFCKAIVMRAEAAERENSNLRFELQITEHSRLRDNEFLLGQRDEATNRAEAAEQDRDTWKAAFDRHDERLFQRIRERDELAAALSVLLECHEDEPERPAVRIAFTALTKVVKP